MVSYHGGRGVGGFSWKRLCLCGQLVTRKGLKQALCRIEDIYILKFLILDSGFAYEIQYLLPAIQCNNKNFNRGQLL